ncbi:hypothetical protein F4553_006942 [Allocatelliglobosispora scoriae]|uniref:Uncharacterized protein n=1 Tax=Allocatelliglobosispora scoriae TaxID=643052 RepID=A0A841C189_9ACTN|nr:hypothetical protein [Allocatelliglobosispora scoriae]MBB5873508.1 hypothetical protein [Allocatelliglobosispora scoriae]
MVDVPEGVRPMSLGTVGGVVGATSSRRSFAAVARHTSAAAVPSANRVQGCPGSIPRSAASSANCSTVSSEEWFCGCPCVGSP